MTRETKVLALLAITKEIASWKEINRNEVFQKEIENYEKAYEEIIKLEEI
ncbi:MAG: hypothetical protein FWC16_03395 [Defluviitaleaceae bacterium]|nr:hypothetical protein [Defluviitaleaceae bacterium]MCL2273947.1 hypothetical protein [Defluviitaleaceae bacterium]